MWRLENVKRNVCALITDLSEVFDNVNYLPQAKLKTYGFLEDTLTLICSYLKCYKQKVIVNNSASTIQTIIAEVPQGSKDASYFSIYLEMT